MFPFFRNFVAVNRTIPYILLFLLLLTLQGCSRRSYVVARLDALDSLLNLPPTSSEPRVNYDSLLTKLDTLMYDVVGSDELEARWNLLYTMAENKADHPLLFDLRIRPAYDYYKEATQDGTRGDSTILHCFALSCFYLGVHYYHCDSTVRLVQLMQKSAEVAQSCHDHYTAYLAQTYLSRQLKWSNNNVASNMAKLALEEYRLSGHRSPYNELCILMDIGYCYLNGTEWKNALRYLEKALSCSVNRLDSLFYGDVIYGLAVYYHKANDPAKSKTLLEECVPHIPDNYENCLYIAEIMIANDSLERAQDYLRFALEKGVREKAIIFSRLQKVALLQHDETKAVIYGDSVLHAFQMKYYDAIHQNYDINVRQLEQDHKIMLAEHRLFIQSSVLTIVFIVFIFLLILFWVILNQRKKRREQARKFEKERIAHQFAEKDKVISMLRKHLTDKSKVIATFKSIGGGHSKNFRLASDDWLYLEKTLDEVDGNFISNLRMQYPQIDYDSIKLSMLLRIGLNNKQIAAVFNLTIEAIKKRKQRLRKYVDVTPLQKDISSI